MQLFPFLSPALFLAYPLTVSGSLSNSYVKFPIQKAADIPELQDASGFFKRSDDLNSTLINTLNSGMYVVKMEIGTPPQPVYLQVDTGSSDMYVNVADSAYCKSISEGSDYASTDNYELTATFTGLPSTTISSETYNTLCSLHNFTFGVSNDTTNNNGILGVSIPSAEFTDTLPYTSDFDVTPHTYDNFPIALKDQGKIEKIAYSLFLNEPNAHFGSILFGAVDKSKYSGQLYTLPMLEAYNNLDSLNQGMFVTAQSVAILDGKSGNKTVSDVRFPVLFDSGTTFSTLPTEIADAIGKSFDGKYNSRDQGYIFDCSKVNDTLLSVDFGGFNISANISNFVTPAKDHCLLNIVPTDTGVVLGDAFLVDAYVVYDLESREVSIAQANFNDQVENIEIISDSVPGATPAPGYSNTWEYTPGSPIGTGDFYNVSWTSYSELSQYASNFATESVSDEFSSSSSGESSSHKSTKRENLGYKCCRSSFSFSLLSFVSYFLL
ncbi:CQS_1a_G0043630.mRNA.1.CDS.1 [Saccharomyces cerevisiae]|nr:CQS_1a_G0043630.mRNA.1.CDS.1 [Saccharomyces cerevisiae]CAI7436018.1 CQS_1a_G0043630.mRNA.1.CDS.1 [Saccharomyces cerevisiae]